MDLNSNEKGPKKKRALVGSYPQTAVFGFGGVFGIKKWTPK